MEEEFIVLASLRSSHSEYNKFCSQFAEDASQKERWMLHYDIGKLLVDNEQGYLEGSEETKSLRYLFLEAISPKEARILQNYIRKKFNRSIFNNNVDIIDVLNGDLIELKVARFDNDNPSDYIRTARDKAEKMGVGLVIVDVETGRVIQEPKTFFTVNVPLVAQTILERKAKMKELGIVEVESIRKPIISRLPFFIRQQYNKLEIKEEKNFFDLSKVKIDGKSAVEINLKLGELEEKRKKCVNDYRNEVDEYMLNDSFGSKDYSNISDYPDFKKIMTNKINQLSGSNKSPHLRILNRLEKIANNFETITKSITYQRAIKELVQESLTNKEFDLIDCEFPIKPNEIIEMEMEKTVETLRECHKQNNNIRYPWKCPLIPMSIKDGLENTTTYEILSTLKIEPPEIKNVDWENDYEGFKLLIDEYIKNPRNVLELGSETMATVRKTKKNADKILDLFGVGWKEYKKYENNEDTLKNNDKLNWERPIYEIPKKSGNVCWLESATEIFQGKERETFVMPFLAKRDFYSRHPIDNLAANVVNQLMSKLIFSNILTFISTIENLYNKFGGVLSIIEQKKY